MIGVELDVKAPLSLTRGWSKASKKKVGDAIETIGRKLERDSKQYAPYISGNLRRQIDFKREGATGEVRAKANYSAFVHGPPYHHGANRRTTPFFTMARDANQRDAAKIMKEAVDDAVKLAMKKS